MGLAKDRILDLGDLWDQAGLVAGVNQTDPEVGAVSQNLTSSPFSLTHINQPAINLLSTCFFSFGFLLVLGFQIMHNLE